MSATESERLRCAACGRKPRDEWRAYRDVDDELPVFCPDCAEREFGKGLAGLVGLALK